MSTTPSPPPPRGLAFASLVSGVIALVILIIPFVGVFTSAVLGPLSVVLGGMAVSRGGPGSPYRRTAYAGLVIGLIAVVVLIVFLTTGTYSERAR
jgi:Na+/proline symporter